MFRAPKRLLHGDSQFISRLGPVDWPPRSCDITPLDFYLWGYVKSKCFVDKPATIEALKANITEDISEIPTEVLERVIQNWCFGWTN